MIESEVRLITSNRFSTRQAFGVAIEIRNDSSFVIEMRTVFHPQSCYLPLNSRIKLQACISHFSKTCRAMHILQTMYFTTNSQSTTDKNYDSMKAGSR